MIREVLRTSNEELFVDATDLLARVEKERVPGELVPFRDWLADALAAIQGRAQDHLELLALGFPELLPDILSRTLEISREIRLYNARLVGPLLRVRDCDHLSLRILSWLHQTHPGTVDAPFALSDGAFASWPWPPYPMVYFIPPSGQGGLRYQSLFFHEFGHLLYAKHKERLDPIVGAFQKELEGLLEPRFTRNDLHAESEAAQRKTIVETWYAWTQEFFCDAVGLQVGGPAFLYAFSAYMRLRAPASVERQFDELAHSSHPPARLRIRLLSYRTVGLGLTGHCNSIGAEWAAIADSLGAIEDYLGFYVEDFLGPLVEAIEGMVRIVNPYCFTSRDLAELWPPREPPGTPVQLVNSAWAIYRQDTRRYREWEREAIGQFLGQAKA